METIMRAKTIGNKLWAMLLTAVMVISMMTAATASAEESDGDYSSFTIGVSSLFSSLEPNSTTSDYSDLFYMPLATVDYETGDTVGLMGDVTWSDDRLTMYFEMWDNIYDADGNHITASDALFCWDRAKEEGSNLISSFESWEQTGEYTLEFHLKTVPTMSGQKLPVYIYSQAAYEASSDGFVTMPVSCAIYKVKEFTSDYKLVLERNEDFWATDEQIEQIESVLGDIWTANWDEIELYVISESTQMTIALETGDIDYSANVSGDDLELFEEGGEMSDEYYVWNKVNGLTYVIDYNTDEVSPLSDIRVRQALSYAISNEYIVQMVFKGETLETHEVGGSFLIDYNEDWNTEDNYYQYDLEKAKELLEEAGYGDGLSLTLISMNTNALTDTGVVLQSLLREIGVDLQLMPLEGNVLTEYRESSRSNWDLFLKVNGSDDYIVNAWSKVYSQTSNSWEGTSGYYIDETLDEMLTSVSSYDGYSEEAVEEFHEYAIELCLSYGLCNAYDNIVVERGVQTVTDPTGQKIYWNAFYWE